MKRYLQAALVAVSAMLLATPALAWTCHAKNARGANYYGSAILRAVAVNRAIAKCQADSLAPGSCIIVDCTIP
jgi:hypothetical protein